MLCKQRVDMGVEDAVHADAVGGEKMLAAVGVLFIQVHSDVEGVANPGVVICGIVNHGERVEIRVVG